MARQGISKNQVHEAAAALRDEGIAPTVQAVRDRIGSGSFSTISGHLAEWKAENIAQGPADIPPMPDKVQGAFQQIWATAARSGQEAVETERQALEAMRREMDKERAEMGAEIRHLESALEEASGRADRTEKALSAAQEAGAGKDQQITQLQIDNARLDERVKAAETRGSELSDQLKDLHTKFAEAIKEKKTETTPRKKTAPARRPKTP